MNTIISQTTTCPSCGGHATVILKWVQPEDESAKMRPGIDEYRCPDLCAVDYEQILAQLAAD